LRFFASLRNAFNYEKKIDLEIILEINLDFVKRNEKFIGIL